MPLMATHGDIFCLSVCLSLSLSRGLVVLLVLNKNERSFRTLQEAQLGTFLKNALTSRAEPDGYYTRPSFSLLCYLLN
jgi:hypothetical protein